MPKSNIENQPKNDSEPQISHSDHLAILNHLCSLIEDKKKYELELFKLEQQDPIIKVVDFYQRHHDEHHRMIEEIKKGILQIEAYFNTPFFDGVQEELLAEHKNQVLNEAKKELNTHEREKERLKTDIDEYSEDIRKRTESKPDRIDKINKLIENLNEMIKIITTELSGKFPNLEDTAGSKEKKNVKTNNNKESNPSQKKSSTGQSSKEHKSNPLLISKNHVVITKKELEKSSQKGHKSNMQDKKTLSDEKPGQAQKAPLLISKGKAAASKKDTDAQEGKKIKSNQSNEKIKEKSAHNHKSRVVITQKELEKSKNKKK